MWCGGAWLARAGGGLRSALLPRRHARPLCLPSSFADQLVCPECTQALPPPSATLRAAPKPAASLSVSAKPHLVSQGEFVFGVQCVGLAIAARRRPALHRLLVSDQVWDAHHGDGDAARQGPRALSREARWVLKNAPVAGVGVEVRDKHDLNLMTGDRPHQGFVLDAAPLPRHAVDALGRVAVDGGGGGGGGGGAKHLWVVLDGVTDPQNLGAVVRSCLYLGVCGVVLSARHSAPLSPVASRASAGALEVVRVVHCDSVHKFLMGSKREGWHVIGTTVNANTPGAIACSQARLTKPSILVLGSEGEGVRRSVLGTCDEVLTIPPATRRTGWVDSLNVGVAAGVLLHSLLRN